MSLHVSRRAALSGAAAAAAALALPSASRAAAPMSGAAAPAWHRFKIGDMEATVVSDGPLALGPPADAFKGAAQADLERTLRDAFLPTSEVVLEQNVLVLNTGRQLVVLDTGMGPSKLFGPTTGRFLANFRAAGFEPGQVDAVVVTHAHSDHCFGLTDAEDKPVFPNARVFVAKADFDFWTDEGKLGGPMKDFVEGARRNLLAVRDRLGWVEDGKEVVPGVTAVAAPGHTVGHTCYMVSSGRDTIAFTGDICHHQEILLRMPRLEFAYDTDPAQAVRSRLRVLDMLAADRTPLVSYHFPFPGVGHVAKAGDGYRWHPAPMKTLL